jgi:hypothetical protein
VPSRAELDADSKTWLLAKISIQTIQEIYEIPPPRATGISLAPHASFVSLDASHLGSYNETEHLNHPKQTLGADGDLEMRIPADANNAFRASASQLSLVSLNLVCLLAFLFNQHGH